jgi:hypothetical protein
MENAMAFISAPQTVKVAIEYLLFGRTVVNVLHFDVGEAVSDSRITDSVQAVANWWDSYLSVNASHELAIARVVGTDVSIENGHQVIQTTFTNPIGQNAGDSPPASVAIVISLRTARIGRSYRGRIYLMAPTLSYVDDNALTGPGLAAFQAVADGLITSADGADVTLSVVSYQHNKQLRLIADVTPVTTATVNARVDTQRRRLGR